MRGLNDIIMDYKTFVRKSLFSLSQKKALFINALNILEPAAIKQIFDVQHIKDVIAPSIPIDHMFSYVAIKAVKQGRTATIKFLVNELKLDFNQVVDKDTGSTLLHEACLREHIEIVKILLRAKFNPNAVNKEGQTPLHCAVRIPGKGTKTIPLLIQYGARFEIREKNGMAPIHVAALVKNGTAISVFKHLARDDNKINLNIKWEDYNYGNILKNFESQKPVNLETVPEESTFTQAIILYYKGMLSSTNNRSDLEKAAKLLTSSWQAIKELAKDYKDTTSSNVENNIAPLTSETIPLSVEKIDETQVSEESYTVYINPLQILIDVYFLTKSQEASSVIKYFNALSYAKDLDINFSLNALIRIASFFSTEHIDVQQAKLILDSMLNKINSTLDLSTKIGWYNNIIVVYNKLGLYKEAQALAQSALPQLSGNESNTLLANLYYNIAHTQKYLMQFESSTANYEKAFSFKIDDKDIFREHIFNLINAGKYEEAKKICEQSKCGDHTLIFENYIKFLLGEIPEAEFLSIINKDYSNLEDKILALDLKSDISSLISTGQHNALETILSSLALSLKAMEENREGHIRIGFSIARALKYFIANHKYEEGLEFLQKKEREFPLEFANNYLLRNLTAMIYRGNGDIPTARKLIKDLGPNPGFLSALYLDLAINSLNLEDNKSIQASLSILEEALKEDPGNIQPLVYKFFILSYIGEKEKTEEITKIIDKDLLISLLKQEGEDKPEGHKTQAATSESIEKTEQGQAELYDQAAIHKFIQAEKKAARYASALSQQLLPTPQPIISWAFGDQIITADMKGVTSFKSIFHPNYYAMIGSNLSNTPHIDQFKIALTKGLCSSAKGENGIKDRGNLYVLKIDEDARLFTQKVYKNPMGKVLVIFDEAGDHTDVENRVNLRKRLQRIPVPSLPEQQLVKIYPVTIQYDNPMVQVLYNNPSLSPEICKMGGANLLNKFIALGADVNQNIKGNMFNKGLKYVLEQLGYYTLQTDGKLIKAEINHLSYKTNHQAATGCQYALTAPFH